MRTLILLSSSLAVALFAGWGVEGLTDSYNLSMAGQSQAVAYGVTGFTELFRAAARQTDHCLAFSVVYLLAGLGGVYALYRQSAAGALLAVVIGAGTLLFEAILLQA